MHVLSHVSAMTVLNRTMPLQEQFESKEPLKADEKTQQPSLLEVVSGPYPCPCLSLSLD